MVNFPVNDSHQADSVKPFVPGFPGGLSPIRTELHFRGKFRIGDDFEQNPERHRRIAKDLTEDFLGNILCPSSVILLETSVETQPR